MDLVEGVEPAFIQAKGSVDPLVHARLDPSRRGPVDLYVGIVEHPQCIQVPPVVGVDCLLRDIVGPLKNWRKSVDDLLHLLGGRTQDDALPRLRDALLDRGEKLAASGHAWVQFTERGRSWNGAMLYVGEDPTHAQLAPEQD
jgi:hypothetical protein